MILAAYIGILVGLLGLYLLIIASSAIGAFAAGIGPIGVTIIAIGVLLYFYIGDIISALGIFFEFALYAIGTIFLFYFMIMKYFEYLKSDNIINLDLLSLVIYVFILFIINIRLGFAGLVTLLIIKIYSLYIIKKYTTGKW